MQPLKTVNAEELSAHPFPPPVYYVKDLIPCGLSVLGGASKAGKSWLVLWIAMRVSGGLPVWDRPTTQCEVLYLCLEDSYSRIQRRMYQLGEEPAPELRFAIMSEKLHEGLEDQITEHLQNHPNTGLIIIDTFQRVRNPHAAETGSMYACDYDDMVSLKQLADHNRIGILLVHHLRKTRDKEDPFNELNGSNGVMGGLDTCLLLKRKCRGADTATLMVTGRDMEDQTLELTFREGIWDLAEPEEEREQPDRYPAFLYALASFMQTRPSWEGTATELLRALDESEIKANGVVRCFARYYYEFLEPRGITYHTRRTGESRRIYLTRSDANDANDDKNAAGKTSSLSSQSSLSESNNKEEAS